MKKSILEEKSYLPYELAIKAVLCMAFFMFGRYKLHCSFPFQILLGLAPIIVYITVFVLLFVALVLIELSQIPKALERLNKLEESNKKEVKNDNDVKRQSKD